MNVYHIESYLFNLLTDLNVTNMLCYKLNGSGSFFSILEGMYYLLYYTIIITK